MIDSGITKEQLAAVVVKNRGQGVHNEERDVPQAGHRRRRARLEGGLRAAAPVHAVLTQRGRGRGGAARPAPVGVQLRAAALRSHLPGHVLNEGSPLCGLVGRDPTPPTALAAADAYAAAGLGPDDIDVAECQDTDAARELLAYEELGSVRAGGRRARCSTRAPTAMGGRIPVNPSGGLLSKGEPLGASAIGQVVELTHQLQGPCGSTPGRGRPGGAWPRPSDAAPTPASPSSAADPDSRDARGVERAVHCLL